MRRGEDFNQYYFHDATTDEIEDLTANSPFVRRTRDSEEIVLPLPFAN